MSGWRERARAFSWDSSLRPREAKRKKKSSSGSRPGRARGAAAQREETAAVPTSCRLNLPLLPHGASCLVTDQSPSEEDFARTQQLRVREWRTEQSLNRGVSLCRLQTFSKRVCSGPDAAAAAAPAAPPLPRSHLTHARSSASLFQ